MVWEKPAGEVASAAVRFGLREVIAHWNRCLDAQDVAGMADVSSPEIVLAHEDAVFDGPDALARFAAVHGSTAAVARRTHVNHLQAWRQQDRIVTRSLMMVVQLVPDTSPFGAGAASPGWVGYAEDEFDVSSGRPVFLSRRFVRWGGEVLSAFPEAAAVDA